MAIDKQNQNIKELREAMAVQKIHEQNLKGASQRLKVFVFKDDKSESYGPPIIMQTRGMFLREVMENLPRQETVWAKHPMDFSLFEIGEYCPTLGVLYPYEVKTCLGLVQDLKNSSAN